MSLLHEANNLYPDFFYLITLLSDNNIYIYTNFYFLNKIIYFYYIIHYYHSIILFLFDRMIYEFFNNLHYFSSKNNLHYLYFRIIFMFMINL